MNMRNQTGRHQNSWADFFAPATGGLAQIAQSDEYGAPERGLCLFFQIFSNDLLPLFLKARSVLLKNFLTILLPLVGIDRFAPRTVQ